MNKLSIKTKTTHPTREVLNALEHTPIVLVVHAELTVPLERVEQFSAQLQALIDKFDNSARR